MKVTFLNEPGEGTGVARSFYTALAEAILSNQKIPNLEGAQVREKQIDWLNFIMISSTACKDI